MRDLRAAASALGLRIVALSARDENEIDTVFTTLTQQKIQALLVTADGFFFGLQDKLATLAAGYAVPAFYPLSDYVLARDLISYGANLSESWRQAGTYVARIVKGAKPSDLPSCSRKNSSLYSTPRRPKPGGFKFHRSCSRSPTRWSSKRAV